MENREKEERELMEMDNKAKEDAKPSAVVGMEEGNDYILHLSKPYNFEGKEYNQVDLSGIENLTLGDMLAVENRVKRGAIDKSTNVMIELTLEYACHLAAIGAGLPVEFFLGLPVAESMDIKSIVRGFLL